MSLRCLGLLFACAFLVIGVRGKTLEVESHAKETHGEKVVVKTVPFDAKRHRLGYRTIEGQIVFYGALTVVIIRAVMAAFLMSKLPQYS